MKKKYLIVEYTIPRTPKGKLDTDVIRKTDDHFIQIIGKEPDDSGTTLNTGRRDLTFTGLSEKKVKEAVAAIKSDNQSAIKLVKSVKIIKK